MIHYLICCKDNPSSAACNRVKLFVKGFNAVGYNCTVHFLDLNSNRFTKFWKLLEHYIGVFFLATKMSKKDVLIIYGETPLVHLYGYIARRTNLIIERTEFPLYLIIKDLPSRSFTYWQSVKNLDYYCKAGAMITCSTALERYLKQFNNNIFISPLIVNLDEFANASDQKKPINDKYIAYCGSLNNNKDGVPTLIRSFAIFHEIYRDIKLVIIGAGSKESLIELNRLIEQHGLADSIILTGAIHHSEMAKWLNNAIMLALARPNNKQAEGGMPSKVGEYLATGVPCVITNVGDLHLYMKDGRDCYMAQPDSVESFAQKMIQCYTSDNTRLVENAKKLAIQFNYDYQAELLGEYIKQRFPEFVKE